MRSLPLLELRLGDTDVRTRTISEADVAGFAELSGDFNPVHMDEEFATRCGFDGRVAHGLLPIAIAAGILGTTLPGLGTVACGLEVQFLAPVVIGDTITALAEVAAIDRGRGRATIALRWSNQRGELVASGTAIVRPPPVPVSVT